MSYQGCKQALPVTADNFLLRGSKLMNTLWVWGVIVYSGHDTKIMLNSVKARPKKSRLEELMNFFILIIFGM
jgi:phospholipid-transporting ATPase